MKEEHPHEMISIVPELYFNLLCVICLGEIHFNSFTLARQVRYRGLKNKEIEKKILLRERLMLAVHRVRRTLYNLY